MPSRSVRVYRMGTNECICASPPSDWRGVGRPPKLLRRDKTYRPESAKELARRLPPQVLKRVTWRERARGRLTSRFAAVRVRPAYRDSWRAAPHPEEWLLVQWPRSEAEPAR